MILSFYLLNVRTLLKLFVFKKIPTIKNYFVIKKTKLTLPRPDFIQTGGQVENPQGSTDWGFGLGHMISGMTSSLVTWWVEFSGMNLHVTDLFLIPLPHIFEHEPYWPISHLKNCWKTFVCSFFIYHASKVRS